MTNDVERTGLVYWNYISKTIGYKIVNVRVEVDDNHGFMDYYQVLLLENEAGEKMELVILCDEEGNGPGHISIEKVES